MRSIEKTLGAFTIKDLQTFRNIVLVSSNEGYSIEKVLDFIEGLNNESKKFEVEQNKVYELLKKHGFICPNCNSHLNVYDLVGHNIDGNKSVFRCTSCIGCKKEDRNDETDPNAFCTYERFDKRPREEIVEKFNKESEKLNKDFKE